MANTRFLSINAFALALILVAAPGCVSKRLFKSSIESTDARVGTLESQAEANERRIVGLEESTNRKLQEMGSETERALRTGTQAMTAAESAAEAARRAGEGQLIWKVTLSEDKVKFPLDKGVLGADAMAELDKLATRVKAMNKGVYLEIEGHTDSSGGDAYNRQLGLERADAVLRYLNEKSGIPLHAMSVISLGEDKPIADNSSREGRAQNRRVVVKVLE